MSGVLGSICDESSFFSWWVVLLPSPPRRDAVALDRLDQDDRRLPRVLDRRLVGGVHLERVVPAALQAGDLLVGQVLDQRLQFGRVEELLADEARGSPFLAA